MQLYSRNQNTTVWCNTAASFPDGILKAHQLLHQIYPSAEGREYFGISRFENGGISYKAAVALAPGESPVTDKFETFVINKGLFLGTLIKDFMSDTSVVGSTFQQLVKDPRVDPDGYCLEEYPEYNSIICMVRLSEERVQAQLRKELTEEYGRMYENLFRTIRSFTPQQFNTVPSIGGWTPGQVTEHIILATGGIPDENTSDAGRIFNEKDETTRSVFTDYLHKMEAPEFIRPDKKDYDQQQQISILEGVRDSHLSGIASKDLFALCLDFELPAWGSLTRYEWWKFISYHTERHLHQLQNIHNVMR
ncbi:DinB family protein [Pseudoflavitalea sp. G-6-1-2]|uniref:DinB family protein n=1 Tax=Pseudoflavitalea sp. G-6-1-2 TaxID=2728841 RepID=UPI00146DB5A4|nr:DinB family protein [Pseudoflavitalea sp. G-6-1-2]NML21359.1 DinB family protein [Pseudoflavitalea sp. G-6-1-2]